MTNEDFASHVALDVVERAAKILPLMQEFCALDEIPITELQAIKLGSILLMCFDGLTDSIESMAACFEVIAPFEGAPLSIGDEVEGWLANRDTDGPLQ